jgi:nitronate monooxygenase
MRGAEVWSRVQSFCEQLGIAKPILLAPMAGVPAPALSVAVGNAGGLGACGALLMTPEEIVRWAAVVRAKTPGPFNLNLWVPDPPPRRDPAREAELRRFLGEWGPPVPPDAGDAVPPRFDDQCEALLEVRPRVVSSVMGLFPPRFVERAKTLGIAWFAGATTLAEAQAAEAAGADVIVVQGMEAGGHRACFDAARAEEQLVGLAALVPIVADAVRVPVVATGGIADGRGVAAALVLGASAVQVGTAFLRCPEAEISPAWADALAATRPEEAILTRAFSGRAGRSIATGYVKAAASRDAPAPAPYPVQRGLTAAMRARAAKEGDVQRMQAWAGQVASLAWPVPAADLVASLFGTAQQLIAK